MTLTLHDVVEVNYHFELIIESLKLHEVLEVEHLSVNVNRHLLLQSSLLSLVGVVDCDVFSSVVAVDIVIVLNGSVLLFGQLHMVD